MEHRLVVSLETWAELIPNIATMLKEKVPEDLNRATRDLAQK